MSGEPSSAAPSPFQRQQRALHPWFLRMGLSFLLLPLATHHSPLLLRAYPQPDTRGSETATNPQYSPRSTPNLSPAAPQKAYTASPYPPRTFAPSLPRQPHYRATSTSPRRP